MKNSFCCCIGLLSLLSQSSFADLVWTGAGNGTSVFQEANWINDSNNQVPSAGAIDGDTPVSSSFGAIVMGLDNASYGPFSPNFDLGGNTLYLSGTNSNLSSSAKGLRSNAGGSLSRVNASGSTTIEVQYLKDLEVSLKDSASLILKAGGNPIDSTTIDLANNWTGEIKFLNKKVGDWISPGSGGGTANLDKITVAGERAVLGLNVLVLSDGATGSTLTVIPEADRDSDFDFSSYNVNVDILPTYDDAFIESWGRTDRPSGADKVDDFDTSGSAESRVRAAILKAFGAANKVHQNSQTGVRLNPVWLHKVDDILEGNGNKFLPEADKDDGIYNTPRKLVGADLAAHFSSWTQGGFDGITRQYGSLSLTRVNAMWGVIFAHEIAHNFGTLNSDGVRVFPSGGGVFHTVMARRQIGHSGIWFYSDPDRLFLGEPLGSSTNDSCKIIADNKFDVANRKSLNPTGAPNNLMWSIINRETGKAIARSASVHDQQVFQGDDQTQKSQTRIYNQDNDSRYEESFDYYNGEKEDTAWLFKSAGTEHFRIKSRRIWVWNGWQWNYGDKYLRIADNSQDDQNGAPILLRNFAWNDRGQWSLNQTAGGFYEIKNRFSDKGIQVPNASSQNGQVLTQSETSELNRNAHWYLRTNR